MVFRILILVSALCAPPVFAAEQGTLFLHRWNQGFKAESETAWEKKMSLDEFREILAGTLPADKQLYSGCYLARFETAPKGRGPASGPQLYKLCIPGKSP